ncbi:hypothetical protein J1N35_044184 [Gossypium stocksii]|uniref:Uncharacterized protein n=1 Tax=Gossypium stocksii TaxID=47602 RepID=A0A9D3U8V8_9ROSI|nr:hypothetical protein J1N35_044184 [Gossypium stocksii]
MPDSNKYQALDNIKKNISFEEKLQIVSSGMLRYQWEYAVRFRNSMKREDRERVGTTSR